MDTSDDGDDANSVETRIAQAVEETASAQEAYAAQSLTATAEFESAVSTRVAESESSQSTADVVATQNYTQPTSTLTPTATPTAVPIASEPPLDQPSPTPASRFDAIEYAFASTWGEHGSGQNQLNEPRGIAVSKAGLVAVADQENERVYVLDAWRPIAVHEDLSLVTSVAFDANDDLIVALGFGIILKLHPSGDILSSWDTEDCGVPDLSYVTDIAIDGANFLYATDISNSLILKFSPDGSCVQSWGGAGADVGQLDLPLGIAIDNAGNVHVAEFGNQRLQKFTSSGVPLEVRGRIGSGREEIFGPTDLAIDELGNIYVLDSILGEVKKYSSDLRYLTSWSVETDEPSATSMWNSIALDNVAGVYITESNVFHMENDDPPPDPSTPRIDRVLHFEPVTGSL